MAGAARKKNAEPNPVDRLKSLLDLNDIELAYLLEATPRTLYRWTEQAPADDYPPLKRLHDLIRLAKESMKEEALAGWFHEPNRALGGSVPIRLAADPRGYQLVYDFLGNAAHGMPL